MKQFVDTSNPNSRPDKSYASVINDIAKEGVCPFCKENLDRYHKLPIEDHKLWIVTDNMYPYKPSKLHKLIILKRHASHATELSVPDWTELKAIIDAYSEKLDIKGGTFFFRFGETKYNGGSVSHIHAHIVQSDPGHKDYDSQKGLITRIG